jgi:hypothetical protein
VASRCQTMELVPYLFVCKSQLVLQDSFPVRQRLYFIGQGVERVRQRPRELLVIHSHGPTVRRAGADGPMSFGGDGGSMLSASPKICPRILSLTNACL